MHEFLPGLWNSSPSCCLHEPVPHFHLCLRQPAAAQACMVGYSQHGLGLLLASPCTNSGTRIVTSADHPKATSLLRQTAWHASAHQVSVLQGLCPPAVLCALKEDPPGFHLELVLLLLVLRPTQWTPGKTVNYVWSCMYICITVYTSVCLHINLPSRCRSGHACRYASRGRDG